MGDCKKCMDRRDFLKLGGVTLFISAVNPTFARSLGDPRLDGLAAASASGKTLIFIFQRFGADGLNTVVPVEAGEYATYSSYRNRTLGLALTDLVGPTSDQRLDANFALHPACKAGLHSLWQQGKLAVLHSVGYPNASRSHFDGQSYIDHGTPFDKTTPDGWLNRWLQTSPANPDPLRAISFSNSMPVPLVGPAPALSFSDISQLSVSSNAARDAKFLQIQGQVYGLPHPGRTYDPDLASSGSGLVAAINAIRAQSLPVLTQTFPNTTFGRQLGQLAQLIKTGAFAIDIAEVDIGGWDTHALQGATTGAFPGLLQQLSDGIYALVNELGPAIMANTVICTVSEFGRTARENGNQGTDHGSAWSTFVTGGAVNPGVYGTWYGLTDLRDNRDLKHSIDFRDLFSEILSKHMGSLDPAVFPGWSYTPVGLL